MAKEKSSYVCSECGGTSPRWLGKCPHCNAWNTLVETAAQAPAAPGKNRLGQQPAFAALAQTAEVTTLSSIEAADVADRQPQEMD